MISNINHLYHEGWDCVCMARSTSSDFFKAFVNCRSLVGGEVLSLPESMVDFDDETQAVELAIQMALEWTGKRCNLSTHLNSDKRFKFDE
jgi:hypothetical protein